MDAPNDAHLLIGGAVDSESHGTIATSVDVPAKDNKTFVSLTALHRYSKPACALLYINGVPSSPVSRRVLQQRISQG